MKRQPPALCLLRSFFLFLFLASCTGDGETAKPVDPGGVAEAESWAPESADLVFMSNHDGNSEIYLLAAGESEWRNLTNHPAGQNWPVWSPDGSRIAYQDWREGKIDVWVMDVDGANPVRLTDHPDHDYLPSWTPDGSRITFVSWRTEPGDEEREAHIYGMSADGSDQRRLVAEPLGTSAGAEWSPNGRTFLLSLRDEEHGTDFYLASAEGDNLRRLTEDGGSKGGAALSPDGTQIAFYVDRSETVTDLVVMNADGTGRRTVLGDGGQNWTPHWSPDGRWLVYTAAVPEGAEGDLDVFAVRADGQGEPRLLVGGPGRQGEGRWRP